MASDFTYTRTTWTKGDVLTAEKLNNIEIALDTTVARINGATNGENSQSLNDDEHLATIADINALNFAEITGSTIQTITSISETAGKISATYSNIAKANGDNFGIVKAGTNLTASSGTISLTTNPSIEGNLTVSGTTALTNGLNVTGNTILGVGTGESPNISYGTTTINGTTIIKGTASLNNGVNVTGNTILGVGVGIAPEISYGTTLINGATTIKGATTVNNNLNVTGTATISTLSFTTLSTDVPWNKVGPIRTYTPSENNQNYPVQFDSTQDNAMYVNVPWTDTTYTASKGLAITNNDIGIDLGTTFNAAGTYDYILRVTVAADPNNPTSFIPTYSWRLVTDTNNGGES